jgi:putative ABC transport system permease protein
MLSDLWIRLRSLFRHKAVEAELDDELRFHLDRQIEKYVRSGMALEAARRRARIELGGLEQTKEECRDARGVRLLETLWQDIRYGARMLRKSPGFTLVAILVLALGIGANTAIFSVVNSALLNPLPYPRSGRLFLVFASNPHARIAETTLTWPDFVELRGHNRVFSAIAGFASHDLTLSGHGEPSIVSTVVVTPQYFSVLGVTPLLGRAFLSADGRRGAPPVAILSENLWRTRYGSDPKILGSSIVLDHRPFTVVGVMPAGFRAPFFPAADQVWIPLFQDTLFRSFTKIPGRHMLATLARLGAGVTRAQAQARMQALAARLAHKFPAQNAGWTAGIRSLQKEVVGPHVRTALLVLLGAVGLLLLIACANIASLLLARATARTREMAVRLALGASRGRLIRQLLAESALLGLLGGLAGVALAFACVQGMQPLLPSALPHLRPIRVSGEVLFFALALSLAASLLFGLAPAFSAANASLHAGLKEAAGRATEARSRRRARNVLAATEIAVAMVLLVGAGLLIRSFAALTSVSPGFNTHHVWQAEISLPRFEYKTPEQWVAFSNQFLSRLEAEPGMKDAAFAVPPPFFVQGDLVLGFRIAGSPPRYGGINPTAHFASVSPDYFRVMGIPLVRGRFFREADSFTGPRVAIVSRAFVRRYFPHEDPIGKRLLCGFPPDTQIPRRIVGIVGDVRDVSLGQAPAPMIYVPFAQMPFWGGPLVVKTRLRASSVYAAIRQATASIDPDLPVTNFQSLQAAIQSSVAQPRFRTLLLSLFGALALALAAVGIFGVLSYSLSQRTGEIGIRLSLGASPGSIRKMALLEGAKLAAVGLGAGALAAFGLARLLRSELYAVTAHDLYTFVAAAVLLAAVALAACYVPARRAMRVDPVTALRHE